MTVLKAFASKNLIIGLLPDYNMTRWIENISMSDAHLGHHSELGPNVMLIRIQDPATEFYPVKHNFKEIHEFEFLDVEDDDNFDDDFKISDAQANQLVDLLKKALDNSMNVIVHCHAGICRSGAVVEVATMMGFTAVERLRIPNIRVKQKMMKVLNYEF